MFLEETKLQGCFILHPKIHRDHRGYFYESYNQKAFDEMGVSNHFVQDNQAFSTKGTLRGLHYQTGSAAQAKLLRVLAGSIYDVAVDLRENSPTYGQYFGLELSADNHLQFYIPEGFAHGYLTLSDYALVFYKCDQYYNPKAEGGLMYDDPAIKIDWPEIHGLSCNLSDRDTKWPPFGKHKAV